MVLLHFLEVVFVGEGRVLIVLCLLECMLCFPMSDYLAMLSGVGFSFIPSACCVSRCCVIVVVVVAVVVVAVAVVVYHADVFYRCCFCW